MKVITRTLLALTAFSLAGIVQAGNASGQSYINYFVAGATYNSGLPEYPSIPGQPGLKLTNFHSGITLTFNALKSYARPDSSGVYSLAYLPPPAMGHFDFKHVAGQEVYYGEWSNNGTHNDPTRVVYYSGDTEGRVLPTATVTYAVQGISNYSGANLLQGELSASFGTTAPTLVGTLSNSSLSIQLAAPINTTDANFNGVAAARNTSDGKLLSTGNTQGSFYGAGANASLAGIAKFANRDYDTAFGGVVK